MNSLQQSNVNAICAARADVKFTVAENGPIAHNHSNEQRTLVAGTVYMDADTFPTITIGPKGGIVVWIKSYPEGDGKTAFDAAIVADRLLAKQSTRATRVSSVMVAGNGGFSTPAKVAAAVLSKK